MSAMINPSAAMPESSRVFAIARPMHLPRRAPALMETVRQAMTIFPLPPKAPRAARKR